MTYLEDSEYEAYGLEATTLAAWVAAASALVDAHCRRATLGVAQYTERVRLGGRDTARLSYLPLATVAPGVSPLLTVRVRYAAPRRGDDPLAADFARAFGLPGAWSEMDVTNVDCDPRTGEVTIPRHPLGLAFNEAEITYNAGLDPIPEAVKAACAQMVKNAQATPALNVRAQSLDKMRMEYFADSVIDESVRKLLAPYVAQRAG